MLQVLLAVNGVSVLCTVSLYYAVQYTVSLCTILCVSVLCRTPIERASGAVFHDDMHDDTLPSVCMHCALCECTIGLCVLRVTMLHVCSV
jgi:hypothetical protein